MEALANEATTAAEPLDELVPLVEDMAQGKESALEALYDATVGKLYALASAIVRRGEDAEEVVCATYAHAWANATRYDNRRATVLGWLLMLCRSRALDVLRQRRAHGELQQRVAREERYERDDRPEDLLNLLQQGTRIHAALAKLGTERRELVALAFLRDLSHAEISQHTGLPLGTVKSHLRRALLQLREHLES
jgi:RNA polymerase sigma-70 factor, ECF subfamily